MLRLLGTSHIAAQSVTEISEVVEQWQPDIIAVELDLQRAIGLLSQERKTPGLREIAHVGVAGYLFVLIGQFTQKKLGKMVGVSPGAEMKHALLLAKKQNKLVAYIDQPIQKTLRNFSKRLTLREIGRFLWDISFGALTQRQKMKSMTLDLSKVPSAEVIVTLIGYLKERYPSVYQSIIADRDKYMVRKLVAAQRAYPEKKILAIVGAGHLAGMERLLQKIDVVR